MPAPAMPSAVPLPLPARRATPTRLSLASLPDPWSVARTLGQPIRLPHPQQTPLAPALPKALPLAPPLPVSPAWSLGQSLISVSTKGCV